jgi:hypothetical protein
MNVNFVTCSFVEFACGGSKKKVLMSDTAKQEAAQLLEQAKVETDVDTKIGLLENVLDICRYTCQCRVLNP